MTSNPELDHHSSPPSPLQSPSFSIEDDDSPSLMPVAMPLANGTAVAMAAPVRSYPPRLSSVGMPIPPNFSRPGSRSPVSPVSPVDSSMPPVHPLQSHHSHIAQQAAPHEGHHSRMSSAPSSECNVSRQSPLYGSPDSVSMIDESRPHSKMAAKRQDSLPEDIRSRPASITIARKPVISDVESLRQDSRMARQSQEGLIINGTPRRSHESLPQIRHYSARYESDGIPEITRSIESLARPRSTNTLGSGSGSEGARHSVYRSHLSATNSTSPGASPLLYPQSQFRHSDMARPTSYIDLLQTPYAQQVAPVPTLDNSFLQRSVGTNASLLSTAKTLEMYRSNVKKTNDMAVQYEFAIFLVQTAMEMPDDAALTTRLPAKADLYRESRVILARLADRSYPFAQYYLADGYSSGLFNKGKEDPDKAFPLFVAASKRGHAEAGYRAALCYEFGWGCRKDYAKAVKFFEMAASKNHPGAATRLGLACLQGTMGISNQYRQGVKWLKRAAESADVQYNAAPYELAKLHVNGFGDDIFKDPEYAAQLYTKSADLGHPAANIAMGKAYEHGELGCPKDPGLSIHYYTMAAECGDPEGMMALCAWYLFGAEPVLEQNENEAFEWAKRAADLGYSKAEYAVGYFKEAGIGCQQSSLDANMWYWRAAQQGDERAKARMKVINQAVSGGGSSRTGASSTGTGSKSATKKGLFSKLGR